MLIAQRDIDEKNGFPDSFIWANPLLKQIATHFEQPAGKPDGFPCVFAQKTFSLKNIQFLLISYANESGKYDYRALKTGLKRYLEASEYWDGNISTVEPLLVLFEPTARVTETRDYERVFIESLQYLIDHDDADWKEKTPRDPGREFWSMCFAGVQIFVNVSHPNHIKRRSRNVCDALVFVINPRERFDAVAGNDKKGYQIRHKIRSNIDAYDDIPRSPLLGHYLDGELEWPQYMLPEDNGSAALTCPIHFSPVSDKQ